MKGVEAFTKAELAELEILAAKWVSLENPRAHEYDAYKAAQALSDLQDAALGKISANPLRLLATIDADRTKIARLSKIEERAKDVAGLPAGTGEYSPTRLRSETAQYILEGDLHTQTTKGDT
ncbi:MAG: hypothetical protein WA742_09140 [Candidatus Cybelea sp.]